MSEAIVTLSDGRRAKVTFESQAQLDEAVAGLEGGQSGGHFFPHSFQELGQDLRQVPRQVGLAARYGLEGFGQGALADTIGLPAPQGTTERVIGNAARTLVTTGGIAKGAQLATGALQGAARGVASVMGSNTAGQAGGAIGAGIAGGSVREAGGGPTEEFIASVLGGVAGGVAVAAGSRMVQAAGNVVRRALAPKGVQSSINVALERAGIDWAALSREAQAQLVKDAEKALHRGEPIPPDALRRLADFRNIGATPLRGDITQDPRLLTLQRNLGKQQANTRFPVGGPDIAGIENQNAKRVLSTLEGVADSPHDTYATGQRIIGAVSVQDNAMRTAENALYTQARAAAGREIPLRRAEFVNEAFDNLVKSNKQAFLPAEIRQTLNQISTGKVTINGQQHDVPFNVDTIDGLKTTLATASRNAKDGNVRAAIAAVRNALENVRPDTSKPGLAPGQVTTAAQGAALQRGDAMPKEALQAFDAARAAARTRRVWQESAPFIEDALSGMEPDKFVQKHVINTEVANLAKLRASIGKDKELAGAVRKQLVGYILKRGGADSDVTKFSSAGMTDALKAIGDRKLSMFFTKSEIQQIRSAVNVGRYIQSQPIGSAVNNSNTGAMVVGRLMDALLGGATKVPVVGPLVVEPLIGAKIGLEARQVANIPNALLGPRVRQPVPLNQLAALALVPPHNDDRRDRPTR